MRISYIKTILVITTTIIFGSSCANGDFQVSEPEITSTGENIELVESTPLIESTRVELPELQSGSSIRQWVAGATADSEFASPEWSASQVIGPPDTVRCGDYASAWASAESDGIATLVLTYTIPVNATGIKIHQTFNPNQVVNVDVITVSGDQQNVYEAVPMQVDQPCPYILNINFPKTSELVDSVMIVVDQSVLGLGWNEIDAIELVGQE